MTNEEAYIAGFCKAAEAAGVDPDGLMKFAGLGNWLKHKLIVDPLTRMYYNQGHPRAAEWDYPYRERSQSQQPQKTPVQNSNSTRQVRQPVRNPQQYNRRPSKKQSWELEMERAQRETNPLYLLSQQNKRR